MSFDARIYEDNDDQRDWSSGLLEPLDVGVYCDTLVY